MERAFRRFLKIALPKFIVFFLRPFSNCTPGKSKNSRKLNPENRYCCSMAQPVSPVTRMPIERLSVLDVNTYQSHPFYD